MLPNALPLYLNLLISSYLLAIDRAQAFPEFGISNRVLDAFSFLQTSSSYHQLDKRTDLNQLTGINLNPNGTPFLWLPDDEYSGKTFFEYDFFTD